MLISSPSSLAWAKSKFIALRIHGDRIVGHRAATPAATVSSLIDLVNFQPGKPRGSTSPRSGFIRWWRRCHRRCPRPALHAAVGVAAAEPALPPPCRRCCPRCPRRRIHPLPRRCAASRSGRGAAAAPPALPPVRPTAPAAAARPPVLPPRRRCLVTRCPVGLPGELLVSAVARTRDRREETSGRHAASSGSFRLGRRAESHHRPHCVRERSLSLSTRCLTPGAPMLYLRFTPPIPL